MTLQQTETPLKRIKGSGAIVAIGAALVWGVLCGVFRLPYFVVVVGGLGTAALGNWLEWAILATPENRERKDFYLLAATAFAFFAVIGVGLVSLAALVSTWYLPRL